MILRSHLHEHYLYPVSINAQGRYKSAILCIYTDSLIASQRPHRSQRRLLDRDVRKIHGRLRVPRWELLGRSCTRQNRDSTSSNCRSSCPLESAVAPGVSCIIYPIAYSTYSPQLCGPSSEPEKSNSIAASTFPPVLLKARIFFGASHNPCDISALGCWVSTSLAIALSCPSCVA